MTEFSPEAFDAAKPELSEAEMLEAAIGVLSDFVQNPTSLQSFAHVMEAVVELKGGDDCDNGCKFYGSSSTFCDRSCDIPMWDQI